MSDSLTVVVPCYNEAARLDVDRWHDWARRYPQWTWLFVNDGSTDETGAILDRLAEQLENVFRFDLPANAGKAEAVRQGLLWALQRPTQWIGYLDADLATSPAEVEDMLNATGDDTQIVIGCRLRRLGARIRRSHVRHYGGRVVASAISIVARILLSGEPGAAAGV